MKPASDPGLATIRAEYARRDHDARYNDRYAPTNPAALLEIQQRQQAVAALLRRTMPRQVSALRLVDMGCGTGGPLQHWIGLGLAPEHCTGVDLLPERLAPAQTRLPVAVGLVAADAGRLPFADASFDIVSQFTMMSSVLDDAIRERAAAEMLRILKPGGMIVWYDFWLNPNNRRTRGIGRREIRRLFPGCSYDVQRVTLAPPIARRLAPFSPLACRCIEALRAFNSHYLVGIRRSE